MTVGLTLVEAGKKRHSAGLPRIARAAFVMLPLVSLPVLGQVADTRADSTEQAMRALPTVSAENPYAHVKHKTETKTVKVGSDVGDLGKVTRVDGKGVAFNTGRGDSGRTLAEVMKACSDDPVTCSKNMPDPIAWRIDYGRTDTVGRNYDLGMTVTANKGVRPGTATLTITRPVGIWREK